MKVLHSFTARILAIMVALLLLFCAVSTLAWYRSFTREAVETAQAHLDTVIETLNETFEESLRESTIRPRLFPTRSAPRRTTALCSF